MKKIILCFLAFVLILVSCSEQSQVIDNSNLSLQEEVGMCDSAPEVCPEIYQPVCGIDGQTYPNACFACQKVPSYEEGICASTVVFFSKTQGEKVALEFARTLTESDVSIIESYPGPLRCADCWTYIVEYVDNDEVYKVELRHSLGKIDSHEFVE